LTWIDVTDNLPPAMLEALEQLLILQDRDRKITYLNNELTSFDAQAKSMESKALATKTGSEAAKQRVMELEAVRKKLELDVDAKKQQIEKYALQQYQTKKNEEYRALGHEIDMAKEAITKIEDEILKNMELTEQAQKDLAKANQLAKEARSDADQQIQELRGREENLRKELASVTTDRAGIAASIDEEHVTKYERLRRNKGDKVVVGIEHAVCGGCHMRLPAQVLVSCQAEQEISYCLNCGRMLYYTRDMSLTPKD
jgi:predicted  nucleic acid-binding Zn-ribbon protein